VVEEPKHALFARNLYPEEIAAALLKAMREDELVEQASVHNLQLVRTIANRPAIRARTMEFYRRLAD
jgi:uncharacterized protein (DUF2336 family)